MRYALVDQNYIVTNLIEYDPGSDFTPPPGHSIKADDGSNVIGQTYVSPPNPDEISRRQFFQLLAIKGIISQDDAVAAAGGGVIPAALLALLNQLPADQQFSAKMLVASAQTFQRSHPFTAQIGEFYGMSPTDLDAFWADARQL
jgi:hypothetical protein